MGKIVTVETVYSNIRELMASTVHTDGHSIHTPLKMIREILDQIPIEPGQKVAVVHTFEFIPVLKMKGINFSDITYITPCANKAKIAAFYGVKVVNKSALEWETDMKFDVVVGNPPYQISKDHGRKVNVTAWSHFFVKSLNIVNEHGYLTLVLPTSWTSPAGNVIGLGIGKKSIFRDFMKPNNLLYVNLDNKLKDYFPGVGSTFSTFVLQKSPYQGKTRIIHNSGDMEVNVSNIDFIPKFPESLVLTKKVINFDAEKFKFKMNRAKLIKSATLQNSSSVSHPYPWVNSHSGKPLYWSDVEHPDQRKKKIMVNYVGKYAPKVDDGKLGMTTEVNYQILDVHENENNILSLMTTKLYRFIIETNRWTQYLENNVMNMLPKLSDKVSWDDRKIYQHFNLTDEEIAYIEANVK